jgi:hypothetical protein
VTNIIVTIRVSIDCLDRSTSSAGSQPRTK